MLTLKRVVGLLMLVAGLTASASAQHSVVLSWTAPPAQTGVAITVYNVYRASASGGQVMGTHPLDPTGVAGTTFTDSTVAAGQTYYYKVTSWCPACGSGGTESPFSNEYKAVIPANALIPGAPTITTVVIQ